MTRPLPGPTEPYCFDTLGRRNRKSRHVVIDGRVYNSISTAAQLNGIHRNTLSAALARGMRRYGGHSIGYATAAGRGECRTAQI